MKPPNHYQSSRWPKALALLTEEGVNGASFVKAITLMAEAAYCEKCNWRGPLRGPSEEGQVAKDAVAHYRWHQRLK